MFSGLWLYVASRAQTESRHAIRPFRPIDIVQYASSVLCLRHGKPSGAVGYWRIGIAFSSRPGSGVGTALIVSAIAALLSASVGVQPPGRLSRALDSKCLDSLSLPRRKDHP